VQRRKFQSSWLYGYSSLLAWAQNWDRRLLISAFFTVLLSVLPSVLWDKSAPFGRISTIKISSIHNKYNNHFTWWPIYVFDHISARFFLGKKYFIYVYRKVKIYTASKITFIQKTLPFMRYCEIIFYIQTGHRRQYGACALRTVQMLKFLKLKSTYRFFNECINLWCRWEIK
jgi:hypothetical protein